MSWSLSYTGKVVSATKALQEQYAAIKPSALLPSEEAQLNAAWKLIQQSIAAQPGGSHRERLRQRTGHQSRIRAESARFRSRSGHMTRSDERKEVEGHLARTPAAARAAEASHLGHESEAEPKPERGEEGASMARTPAAAKSATARETRGGSTKASTVSSPGPIGHKTVESTGVIGQNQSVRAATAEGVDDDASSKANRKEADEPEREADEKAAISRDRVQHSGPVQTSRGGRDVPTKNTIGWGERTPVAKNTV